LSTLPIRPALRPAVFVAAALAAVAPALLAYNLSPSPTFLNQALALGLWGLFVALAPAQRPGRGAWPVAAALAVMAAAVLWSWGPGGLPASLALSALGLLAAAAVMMAAGTGARSSVSAEDVFALFCLGWLVAGLLNAGVAVVQVFAPDLPDGDWIAHSSIPGRAVGNLRQPNHLSSLLLWAGIAVIALAELRRIGPRWAAALLGLMVFGVVLTASRTGLVSVVLLALWGLADRRLARHTRTLLLAAPAAYAAAWWGMAQWAAASSHSFGGAARLAESDISGSRFGIWANTLALIKQQPWAGVGWGEFNFAWSLTPFPGRPTAFFDHTHNLPLQLAVELGLPLAALVMALLLWGLWRAARTAWTAAGGLGAAQRCAWVMVVMIGLHSLLEYPLWYAYFLLPAAWAWGFALAGPAGAAKASGSTRGLTLAGWALAAGAAFSVWDYQRVAVIFSAPEGSAPLVQRIAAGQHSVFFAHHADYAAVTSTPPYADDTQAFDRATHYLLDTRLMTAWARHLAARGELDSARHLAARLREFGRAEAGDFFNTCAPDGSATQASAPSAPGSFAAAASAPFQCELPVRVPDWREFLPR
jgi:O-antigen ligase